MLIDWFIESYKKAVNFIAWLLLIVIPICCFIIVGKSTAGYYSDFNLVYATLGAILSFILVFISEFITLPPLMILFSIDSKVSPTKTSTSEAEAPVEVKENNSIQNTQEPATTLVDGGKWIIVEENGKKFCKVQNGNPDNYFCPKCKKMVAPTSSSCFNCGGTF